MITPKDVIDRLGVEGLCASAEKYFSNIADPTPQLGKPFANLLEAPGTLHRLGLLLAGLRLGKTMVVLDFGAGTCWLSRFLNEAGCATISLDPSPTALRLGRKLFEEHKVIGSTITPPQFLQFDGYRIQLPDEHVDRIVCFDAFHHVPNQRQVLSELARVLKTGGIAGFCEPGIHHSQNPQSQYEMANYDVLENDIDPRRVYEIARSVGFTRMSCKLADEPGRELSFDEYQEVLKHKRVPSLRLLNKFWSQIYQSALNASVFFLFKGQYVSDSRGHIGLAHSMTLESDRYAVKAGIPLRIPVRIRNAGSAIWLNSNIVDLGIVNLGVHLYNQDHRLLNLDFSRTRLDRSVAPGETVSTFANVAFDSPGTYNLALDLVSEGVAWFENLGSKPLRIRVDVR